MTDRLVTTPTQPLSCDECGSAPEGNQLIPIVIQGLDENTGTVRTGIELRCIHCPPDCYHVRFQGVAAIFPPVSSWNPNRILWKGPT